MNACLSDFVLVFRQWVGRTAVIGYKRKRQGVGSEDGSPPTLEKFSKISSTRAKFCLWSGKNVGKQWNLCRAAPLDFSCRALMTAVIFQCNANRAELFQCNANRAEL